MISTLLADISGKLWVCSVENAIFTFVNSIIDCKFIVISVFPLHLVKYIYFCNWRIFRRLHELVFRHPSEPFSSGIEIVTLADSLLNVQENFSKRIIQRFIADSFYSDFPILKNQTLRSPCSANMNSKKDGWHCTWFSRKDYSTFTFLLKFVAISVHATLPKLWHTSWEREDLVLKLLV